MKVFLFVFLLTLFQSGFSAYTLNQIEGINRTVSQVNFDSNGNTYVATYHRLHKLDPTDEILWAADIPDNVGRIIYVLVSSKNDVFLLLRNYDQYNDTIAVVKSGSSTVELIEQYSSLLNFFFSVDNDGNLFYTTEDNAVFVCRPDSFAPVRISNLEDYYVNTLENRAVTVDKDGNVYFLVQSKVGKDDALALITKEALQEDIPYATLLNVEEEGEFPRSILADDYNHLWIFMENWLSKEGVVKKLANGIPEVALIDKGHNYVSGVLAKDNILILANEDIIHSHKYSIYYLTMNNEVIDIPELENVTMTSRQIISDSDGNVYISSYEALSPSLGHLVVINRDEMKPIPIKLGDAAINRLAPINLDGNGGLWVLMYKQGIYYLKKGETVPANVLTGSCGDWYTNLYINLVTNKIYVSCSGLYVVVEQSSV